MFRPRIGVVALLLIPVVCGCGTGSDLRPDRRGSTVDTSASGATSKSVDIMAYINDQPVSMDALKKALLRGPGYAYSQEIVRAEIVNQEMKRKGLAVTDEEILIERDKFLAMMVPAARTDSEKERLLDQLLAGKQVSRAQWMQGVILSAKLRKLAIPEATVTDEMLLTEFRREYGAQMVVRDIETKSLGKIHEILRELQAGADFGKLAWKFSISESRQDYGLLDPISSSTKNVPRAVAQAAESLKKAGDISEPIQTGSTFHLVKLEQIIEPKNVKFEDVEISVRETVMEGRIRYQQGIILRRLQRAARVKYVNVVLRHADEDAQAKMNEARP